MSGDELCEGRLRAVDACLQAIGITSSLNNPDLFLIIYARHPIPQMQNVYFISGLGADKRAFQFLNLSFCNPVFIEWVKPLPAETMSEYAIRLKEQITDVEPIIVGLSFGGMIGTEIAKQFPVKKLILLSSAKNTKELPFYLKMLRYVPLHKIVSASLLRSANQLTYRLLGIAKREDKKLFEIMFNESDATFVKWAINEIIHWKNDSMDTNIVHIHGTADVLLPYRFVKADHTVKGGAHLMLMRKPEEISSILKEILNRE